jgi:hypothetical protein
LVRQFAAGQYVLRSFPHNDPAGHRFEERMQRNLTLFAAHSVPRNPNGVGRPELGGSVVFGKIVGRKDKFPSWLVAVRVGLGVVKPVNDELAFHRDRLAFVVVEVDACTETSRWAAASLVVDRVAPQYRHLARLTDWRIIGSQPGDCFTQAP